MQLLLESLTLVYHLIIFYASISVVENTGVDHSIYTFAVAETSGKSILYTIVSGNEEGECYFFSDLKELS